MSERHQDEPLVYIQRPGALAEIGRHLAPFTSRALIVAAPSAFAALRPEVEAALDAAGIASVSLRFGGACTAGEIRRIAEAAMAADCDTVIGLGGGSALDAAKIAARHQGAALVSVPTAAASTAATTAFGIVRPAAGMPAHVVACHRPAELVLVDSAVIAAAPARLLAAGMGGVLARICEAEMEPESGSAQAGLVVAAACHDALMRDGRAAIAAAASGRMSRALETLIEINLLWAGRIGSDSAEPAAMGIADALAVLGPGRAFFHGETAAFGAIALLVLGDRAEHAINEVLDLSIDLGLPTTLADLGFGDISSAGMARVGEAAMHAGSPLRRIAAATSPAAVADAIRTASRLAEGRRRRAA